MSVTTTLARPFFASALSRTVARTGGLFRGRSGYGCQQEMPSAWNVIERAMILTLGTALQVELPSTVAVLPGKAGTLEKIEREHILRVLDSTRWRVRGKDGAAEILGLKPTTLHSRMKKLDIQRREEAT